MSWMDQIRSHAVLWGMRGLTGKSVDSISGRDFENYFRMKWTGANKVWGQFTDFEKDRAYRNSSAIYSCTRRIVQSASEAIVRVGRRDKDESFKPIPHEVTKLFDKPNPDMSWDMFMQYHHSHLLSTGKSFVWKWRDRRGKVTEIWPIPSHWVKVEALQKKLQQGEKRRFISHFEVTIEGYSRPDTVMPEDMIYGRFVDPDNFVEGVGPLEAAYRDYKIDMERENYLAEMLANMHVPGLIIKQKALFTPDQKKDLRAKLQEAVGKENRGSPLLLSGEEASAEVLEPLKDLDWPGLSNMSEARICAAYGVPPVLVGLRVGLENSPWSNVSEAKKNFYQTTIIDMWNADSFMFTKGLIETEGEKNPDVEIYFDYSGVKALQEDLTELTTRAVNAFDGTICMLDEARMLSGFDRLPGKKGQVWKVPMGAQFVTTDDLIREVEVGVIPPEEHMKLAGEEPEDGEDEDEVQRNEKEKEKAGKKVAPVKKVPKEK